MVGSDSNEVLRLSITYIFLAFIAILIKTMPFLRNRIVELNNDFLRGSQLSAVCLNPLSQKGQAHLKNLAANAARFLKCV